MIETDDLDKDLGRSYIHPNQDKVKITLWLLQPVVRVQHRYYR